MEDISLKVREHEITSQRVRSLDVTIVIPLNFIQQEDACYFQSITSDGASLRLLPNIQEFKQMVVVTSVLTYVMPSLG